MRPFALDLETDLIRKGCQAPPLVCVALGTNEAQTVLPWYAWREEVEQVLRDDSLLLVGHNIAFDMADIGAEEPYFLPLIFRAYRKDRVACTQVRQKLCDVAGGVYRGFDDAEGDTQKIFYDLGSVAARHLKIELDKTTGDVDTCNHVLHPAKPWRCAGCNVPMYGHFRRYNVPIELWPLGAKEYPLGDIRAALGVHAAQESNAAFLEDQYRQTRAAFWLRLMMNWGIRTDAEGVDALARRTQQSAEAIAYDLRKHGLLKPKRTVHHRDGSTTVKEERIMKAVRSRVVAAYTRLGKECPLTDGGKSGDRQPATDRVTCEESGDIILEQYSKFGTLKTVLSKDLPMLRLGIFYPIHSYFEELLETGRTSSAKPNIQNLRRLPGIRECFVPNCFTCGRVYSSRDIEAGHCLVCRSELSVLVGCDYGGLELCTLAQVCYSLFGYSTLGDALNSGKDPHLMIAEDISGIPYDILLAVRKGKTNTLELDPSGQWAWLIGAWYQLPSEDEVDNLRQTGKVANFGFPGGLGPDALVFFALNNYGVRITREEAAALKDKWIRRWVEMRDYFRYVNSITNKPFPQIKQLRSNRYRGGVSYTEACNTLFQGMGADIAKEAGFNIAEGCYVDLDSHLFGCRIVNFIHDEFVIMVPESRCHEAGAELEKRMLDAAAPWLPDVRIKCERVVMRRYSNEAKAIFKNDKMVPWSP